MMPPEIIEKDEFTVVGIEAPFIVALNNFEVIAPLWRSFFERIGEVTERTGTSSYGVIYGRPEGERSHPQECQYLAGAPVGEVGGLPDGMISYVVPPTTFAVFTHRGPIENITETHSYVNKEWLPQSGYTYAGLEIEQYDERFDAESPEESEMEMWFAVTKD